MTLLYHSLEKMRPVAATSRVIGLFSGWWIPNKTAATTDL
jgi:hypothetical protein